LTRISSHRAKFLSLETERSHTEPNPENRVDEESIHSPIRSFCHCNSRLGTAHCLDERAPFCAPISFQMTNVNYASFLAEIWPEGVRRVDLSRCHQMDCSSISWNFTKLIKRPTYITLNTKCHYDLNVKLLNIELLYLLI